MFVYLFAKLYFCAVCVCPCTVCWSPKGKQDAAGKQDANVLRAHQVSPHTHTQPHTHTTNTNTHTHTENTQYIFVHNRSWAWVSGWGRDGTWVSVCQVNELQWRRETACNVTYNTVPVSFTHTRHTHTHIRHTHTHMHTHTHAHTHAHARAHTRTRTHTHTN